MFGSTFIDSMFGSSPVSPLQKHMAKVQACVSRLTDFFDAVLAQDWERAGRIQQDIAHMEGEADQLKKDLRLHLPKGIMLPVSRRDLLDVLSMQDRIANRAKDIAGLIIGRRMHFPDVLAPMLKEYVSRNIETTNQAQRAINELDELVETGFRGREVDLVNTMLQELDEIENETDRLQVAIRAELYQIEKELPPVDVMFIYNIIDWIGDLSDYAQGVGSRLQLTLAK